MTRSDAERQPLLRSVELPLTGTARGIAIAGAFVLLVLFILTGTNALGQAMLWENAHWTASVIAGATLAYLGYRRAPAEERAVRGGLAAGLGLYLVGQLAWDLQAIFNLVTIPAISDIFFLGSTVPLTWGIVSGMRQRLSPAERTAFTIDSTTLVVLVTLIIVVAYGADALITADPLIGALLLLYPVSFLSAAGIGALGGLKLRVGPAWLGINALLGGLALNGLAWVLWVQEAVTEYPTPGSAVNYAFSVAILAVGLGAYRLSLHKPGGPVFERLATAVVFYFPMLAALLAMLIIIAVNRLGPHPAETVVDVGAVVVVLLALARQSLLLTERRQVAEREASLRTAEQHAREAAEASLLAQQASETRYREVVEVFGHLSEQLSFAAEEDVLVRGGVAALRRLVSSTVGDLLLANPSQDRLVVVASWGNSALTIGEPAYDLAPVRCLGIRRGSVYSVTDAADDLLLPCPAHPIERGSLLCVPMLALGETIGVVHLESGETNAFSLDDERQAARVSEQVALAIANARLIKTMESMALTDPLTRLHNARFFDPFLDRELDAARRQDVPLGVIMIDLDHFKVFNDTHGHPAGDEALRVFARAALTMLRDSDTLARYGGEEFVVAVRDSDVEATAKVAERIRSAVEGSSVEVGLGRYASVTASFGVAATTLHGHDRLTLLKSADRALYRAKREGRNRVVLAGTPRIDARGSGEGAEAEAGEQLGRIAG